MVPKICSNTKTESKIQNFIVDDYLILIGTVHKRVLLLLSGPVSSSLSLLFLLTAAPPSPLVAGLLCGLVLPLSLGSSPLSPLLFSLP